MLLLSWDEQSLFAFDIYLTGAKNYGEEGMIQWKKSKSTYIWIASINIFQATGFKLFVWMYSYVHCTDFENSESSVKNDKNRIILHFFFIISNMYLAKLQKIKNYIIMR